VPDIVDLILTEHERLSALIAKLDSALACGHPAGPGSDPEAVWAALAGFLRFHVDAAEEIAYLTLATADPHAGLAIMQACEANADIREAVEEARLSQPGSRTWLLAVQAACQSARNHISYVESGPLDRLRMHAAPAARRALGSWWVAFMTARALDASVRPPGLPS
jgi:hypothetical protein